MKRTFLFVLLCAGFINLFAQEEYLPTPRDLEHFQNTKLYVVLEDSPMSDFNFEIKEVMKKIWNMNDFEFIKNSEFPAKSNDTNASFLYTSLVSFEKDRTDSRYVFLHISLGGPNHTIDDLKDIVSVPLGYVGVEQENYIYKLGTLVRFMQNHIQLMKNDPDIISRNVFKHYNDNIQDVHSKTLYLLADELQKEIGTAARVKEIYPYKFRIVSKEEIRQAIIEGDEDIVFLHKVGPEGKKLKARCYKILIGAGDAMFYYFDKHMINRKHPDAFLESDLKKISR